MPVTIPCLRATLRDADTRLITLQRDGMLFRVAEEAPGRLPAGAWIILRVGGQARFRGRSASTSANDRTAGGMKIRPPVDSTSPSSSRSRHVRRLVGERCSAAAYSRMPMPSSSPRHASPGTPGQHGYAHPGSPQSAAECAFSAASLALPGASDGAIPPDIPPAYVPRRCRRSRRSGCGQAHAAAYAHGKARKLLGTSMSGVAAVETHGVSSVMDAI